MSAPAKTRSALTTVEWAAFGTAFLGAFLLALGISGSGGLATLGIILGILLILGALGLAFHSWRERRAEAEERESWEAFERSLADGVRFEVPEGMGYAAELPAVLDDLRASGEPADGAAKHVIVGEEGAIHWCALQHEHPSGTSTVGLVGLHPDRTTDQYPHCTATVNDSTAESFDQRFAITCADSDFRTALLGSAARSELMGVEPFDWRVEGNQIITVDPEPATPEQQVAFIEQRVKPLARVAAHIPLDA